MTNHVLGLFQNRLHSTTETVNDLIV